MLLSCGILNGKIYPVVMGNAGLDIYNNPEKLKDLLMDPARKKNLKPDFSDPMMNAKLSGSLRR